MDQVMLIQYESYLVIKNDEAEPSSHYWLLVTGECIAVWTFEGFYLSDAWRNIFCGVHDFVASNFNSEQLWLVSTV